MAVAELKVVTSNKLCEPNASNCPNAPRHKHKERKHPRKKARTPKLLKLHEDAQRQSVDPATFELVQQPTNTEFSPKTLATVVSEPSTSYKSAKIHPIQAHSFAVCSQSRIWGLFCPRSTPHPVTYQYRPSYLPAKTSIQLPTRREKLTI